MDLQNATLNKKVVEFYSSMTSARGVGIFHGEFGLLPPSETAMDNKVRSKGIHG